MENQQKTKDGSKSITLKGYEYRFDVTGDPNHKEDRAYFHFEIMVSNLKLKLAKAKMYLGEDIKNYAAMIRNITYLRSTQFLKSKFEEFRDVVTHRHFNMIMDSMIPLTDYSLDIYLLCGTPAIVNNGEILYFGGDYLNIRGFMKSFISHDIMLDYNRCSSPNKFLLYDIMTKDMTETDMQLVIERGKSGNKPKAYLIDDWDIGSDKEIPTDPSKELDAAIAELKDMLY